MRRPLLIKSLVTGVLALLLMAPLGAIRNMVSERQQLSNAVAQELKTTGVGTQRVLGPLLFVPYRKLSVTEVIDPPTGKKSSYAQTEAGELHFLPESLDVRAEVTTETRSRGIYSVLLYRARHTLSGSFVVPESFGSDGREGVTYTWGDPFLVLGVDDPRGIRGTPDLRWDGGAHEWVGGTRDVRIAGGMHAGLPLASTSAGRHEFSISLDLQGIESIDYVPVGKQTTVAMKASWPHPSFGGNFLPESRTITAHGFEALWRTTHLASNIEGAIGTCLAERCGPALTAMGVSFIQPVDVYLQSERAAKYGFLFISITFVVFFLFEVLRKLAIHPVQYGLVGVALALFFLLLLALAEHVPFALAYLVAGVSCIGLLGFYVSHVLRSVWRGLGFTSMLAVLYGALYLLLRSEDLALLLGAALLFAILAAIMFVTRRIDWYRVSADGGELMSR
jgi:inner membrane protein